MNVRRSATISRTTAETDIQLTLCLDGEGAVKINTGAGFFDHMLHHIAYHGMFDMNLSATGDLHVDLHHTVEDVGICFGQALKEALGDKVGIQRYGFFILPMDEALASVVVDLSGRSFVVYSNPLADRYAGSFALDLVEVFLRAVADRCGMNLHVSVTGTDPHHCAEAIFKGLGKALRRAVAFDPRSKVAPSTKGVLE